MAKLGSHYVYSPPNVTQPKPGTVLIDNPTAGTSISVIVGPNALTPTKILFSRFDGESAFSLSLPLGIFPSLALMGAAEAAVITSQNANYAIKCQPVAPEAGFGDLGGLDFIFTLVQKLATPLSSFAFALGDRANVVGSIQPSLTKEWAVGWVLPNGNTIVSVTDTDVIDNLGNNIAHRPDYVVNSIAFYHPTLQGDYSQIGGKDYKTGKIGHLYRMRAVDANKNTAWLDWSMPDSAHLVLTDTTGFLQTATYPVTIQPPAAWFGYNTAGGSVTGTSPNFLYGNGDSYAGAAGTGTSMSIYATDNGTLSHVMMAVYDTTAALKGYTPSTAVPQSGSPAWTTVNFSSSPALSAIQYYVVFQFDSGNIIYYDSNGSVDSRYYSNTYGTFPSTISSWGDYGARYQFSIYCTYMPSGGTTYPVTVNEASITVTDSLIRMSFKAKSLSESAISISDSVVRLYTALRTASEAAISVADSPHATPVRARAISEASISAADSLKAVPVRAKAVNEASISVLDSLFGVPVRAKSISEPSISASDGLAVLSIRNKALSEASISASDALITLVWRLRALSEPSISASDSPIKMVYRMLNITEPSISVSDSLIRVYLALRALSESAISVSDGVATVYIPASLIQARTVNEAAISALDSLITAVVRARAINESVGAAGAAVLDAIILGRPLIQLGRVSL